MPVPNSSDRRLRVLQCVSHLALGGAERVAVLLMENLQNRYDFSLFAVRGLGDGDVGAALRQRLLERNIPLTSGPRVPMRFGGMVTGAIGLARAVRRFKPDLIHLHTEIPEAAYATMVLLFPKLRRIPVVRTIHNSVIWNSWRALGRACDRQLAHACVAGVSRDALQAFFSLRSSSGAHSSSAPATVIYNGVSSPRAIRPKASTDHVIRMIYGGRLEPEKGTDLLPEIIARTRLPAGRRAHLTIYGSGRHSSQLRLLERTPPKDWTVEVHVPITDFADQLGKFDLALIPSRYEGLSLFAIEAVLAGMQVVATDATGLREALAPDHPWLAQTGDPQSFAVALQSACAHEERWPAIAEVGRAFALERFDPLKMSSAYHGLYGQALNRQ